MSTSQRYLGARTMFGVIVFITDCVYNAEAIVRAKDGSTRPYRLPFLIAHGLELSKAEGDVQQDVGTVQPNS